MSFILFTTLAISNISFGPPKVYTHPIIDKVAKQFFLYERRLTAQAVRDCSNSVFDVFVDAVSDLENICDDILTGNYYNNMPTFGSQYNNYDGYLILQPDPLSNGVSQNANTLNLFISDILGQLANKNINVLNVLFLIL